MKKQGTDLYNGLELTQMKSVLFEEKLKDLRIYYSNKC